MSFTLTCCWNCTMSIRFWAPGERLVPISFTRPWTCCMSMPGPRAGLGSTCCSPTMTRHTKTLFLPARDNNWRTRQMRRKQMSDQKSTLFMQQIWINKKFLNSSQLNNKLCIWTIAHLDLTGWRWLVKNQLFLVKWPSVWSGIKSSDEKILHNLLSHIHKTRNLSGGPQRKLNINITLCMTSSNTTKE